MAKLLKVIFSVLIIAMMATQVLGQITVRTNADAAADYFFCATNFELPEYATCVYNDSLDEYIFTAPSQQQQTRLYADGTEPTSTPGILNYGGGTTSTSDLLYTFAAADNPNAGKMIWGGSNTVTGTARGLQVFLAGAAQNGASFGITRTPGTAYATQNVNLALIPSAACSGAPISHITVTFIQPLANYLVLVARADGTVNTQQLDANGAPNAALNCVVITAGYSVGRIEVPNWSGFTYGSIPAFFSGTGVSANTVAPALVVAPNLIPAGASLANNDPADPVGKGQDIVKPNDDKWTVAYVNNAGPIVNVNAVTTGGAFNCVVSTQIGIGRDIGVGGGINARNGAGNTIGAIYTGNANTLSRYTEFDESTCIASTAEVVTGTPAGTIGTNTISFGQTFSTASRPTTAVDPITVISASLTDAAVAKKLVANVALSAASSLIIGPASYSAPTASSILGTYATTAGVIGVQAAIGDVSAIYTSTETQKAPILVNLIANTNELQGGTSVDQYSGYSTVLENTGDFGIPVQETSQGTAETMWAADGNQIIHNFGPTILLADDTTISEGPDLLAMTGEAGTVETSIMFSETDVPIFVSTCPVSPAGTVFRWVAGATGAESVCAAGVWITTTEARLKDTAGTIFKIDLGVISYGFYDLDDCTLTYTPAVAPGGTFAEFSCPYSSTKNPFSGGHFEGVGQTFPVWRVSHTSTSPMTFFGGGDSGISKTSYAGNYPDDGSTIYNFKRTGTRTFIGGEDMSVGPSSATPEFSPTTLLIAVLVAGAFIVFVVRRRRA